MIKDDSDFHQAGDRITQNCMLIDAGLVVVNNNLRQVREEWWRVIRNLKLLRENRPVLRFNKILLTQNLNMMHDRERYMEMREANPMHVEIGEKWGVFNCPECEGEMSIADMNEVTGEIELECANGHAWIVGPAGSE